MSGGAVLLLEWAAAELLPTILADVTARTVHRVAKGCRPHSTGVVGDGVERGGPRLLLVEGTRVLSEAGGRVRLEVAGLKGDPRRAREIDAHLPCLGGIKAAHASWITGNVLIEYEAEKLTLAAIRRVIDPPPAVSREPRRARPRPRNAMQLALGLS